MKVDKIQKLYGFSNPMNSDTNDLDRLLRNTWKYTVNNSNTINAFDDLFEFEVTKLKEESEKSTIIKRDKNGE